MKRWDELKTEHPLLARKWWNEMLYACLRANRRDIAAIIVLEVYTKREINFRNEFWKIVWDNKLYEKAEIPREDLARRMKVKVDDGDGEGGEIMQSKVKDDSVDLDRLEEELQAQSAIGVDEESMEADF